jgi:ZIP family zinc transporter
MNGFSDLNPVVQALIATLGTWALTAAGATVVMFTRKVSRTFLDAIGATLCINALLRTWARA